MLDGPMPRPGDGCFGVILYGVLMLLAAILLGISYSDKPPEKRLCQCGGDECPYTDNHVPKEPSSKAEMHYWSIQ